MIIPAEGGTPAPVEAEAGPLAVSDPDTILTLEGLSAVYTAQYTDLVDKTFRQLRVPYRHAEDYVQQAFERLTRRLGEEGHRPLPVSAATRYLIRTVVNARNDELRRIRSQRGVSASLDHMISAGPEESTTQYEADQSRLVKPEESAVSNEVWESARRLLSGDQFRVLILSVHHRYTLPEIAKLLNVPLGTAKSRLFYARKRMEQALKTGAATAPLPGFINAREALATVRSTLQSDRSIPDFCNIPTAITEYGADFGIDPEALHEWRITEGQEEAARAIVHKMNSILLRKGSIMNPYETVEHAPWIEREHPRAKRSLLRFVRLFVQLRRANNMPNTDCETLTRYVVAEHLAVTALLYPNQPNERKHSPLPYIGPVELAHFRAHHPTMPLSLFRAVVFDYRQDRERIPAALDRAEAVKRERYLEAKKGRHELLFGPAEQ